MGIKIFMENKSEQLSNQLGELQKKANLLFVKKQILEGDYSILRQDVSKNKVRISEEPDVKDTLEMLQLIEHEKSVGAYEKLLTALLNDVMPGDRKVVLELSAERGMPALNIYIQKGEDPLEDVYNGAGGSVSNILSVGLRLIALIRSKKRRFLVLDEADCWIRPNLIPRFAKVIQEMATMMGVQILIISHKDESLYGIIPHKLELIKTANGLVANWFVTSSVPVWEEDMEGIRSIYLTNYQSHDNTFIPLSPGVTMLLGDNDIGKSAIIAALRAVFYGLSNDTMIKHHADKCSVDLDFGKGLLLHWERRGGKGRIKEAYILTDNDHPNSNPLHKSEGAKVPDWLEIETGIGMIEGFDVQLCHQKKPIFLLDETSTLRAKTLAIGDESSYVQKMMALSKEDISAARSVVKSGEKNLELWSRNLSILEDIEDKVKELNEGKFLGFEKNLKRLDNEINSLIDIETEWKQLAQQLENFKSLINLKRTPEIPEKIDIRDLIELYKNWSESDKKISVLSPLNNLKEMPSIVEPISHTLIPLYNEWVECSDKIELLSTLENVKPSVVPDIEFKSSVLNTLYNEWSKVDSEVKILSSMKDINMVNEEDYIPESDIQELKSLYNEWGVILNEGKNIRKELLELSNEEKEINKLIEKEFPACPTCHRPWDNHNDHKEHSK